MLLAFWPYHGVKPMATFSKVHFFCSCFPGFWRPPLIKYFAFCIGIPNQMKFCCEFSFYFDCFVFLVYRKIKSQISCHFLFFFAVNNTLSSSLKRLSQIFLNCSSHLSICFILFTSS